MIAIGHRARVACAPPCRTPAEPLSVVTDCGGGVGIGGGVGGCGVGIGCIDCIGCIACHESCGRGGWCGPGCIGCIDDCIACIGDCIGPDGGTASGSITVAASAIRCLVARPGVDGCGVAYGGAIGWVPSRCEP